MYQIYLFWHDTLHVSDGLSAHHREFKTVRTDVRQILPTASSLQYLSDICLLLHVQSRTPDDGWKDRLKHAECHSKINKFETLVHMVGFTIEIKFFCFTTGNQQYCCPPIINYERTEPLTRVLRTCTANVPHNTVCVFPHPIPYLQYDLPLCKSSLGVPTSCIRKAIKCQSP